MKRANWLVNGDYGNEKCRYCQIPLGQEHKQDCVARRRTIVIEFAVQMVVAVPEDWNQELIEFGFNDSSSCADNIFSNLERLVKRHGGDLCLCPQHKTRYLREATEDDEQQNQLFVKDLT